MFSKTGLFGYGRIDDAFAARKEDSKSTPTDRKHKGFDSPVSTASAKAAPPDPDPVPATAVRERKSELLQRRLDMRNAVLTLAELGAVKQTASELSGLRKKSASDGSLVPVAMMDALQSLMTRLSVAGKPASWQAEFFGAVFDAPCAFAIDPSSGLLHTARLARMMDLVLESLFAGADASTQRAVTRLLVDSLPMADGLKSKGAAQQMIDSVTLGRVGAATAKLPCGPQAVRQAAAQVVERDRLDEDPRHAALRNAISALAAACAWRGGKQATAACRDVFAGVVVDALHSGGRGGPLPERQLRALLHGISNAPGAELRFDITELTVPLLLKARERATPEPQMATLCDCITFLWLQAPRAIRDEQVRNEWLEKREAELFQTIASAREQDLGTAPNPGD